MDKVSAERLKRWPFVESPGEFADRLAAALGAFNFNVLSAVRNVLIENPPEIGHDFLALRSRQESPSEDTRDAMIEAEK